MTCGPMCSVMSAVDCCSDCRSVLMARNSTPSTCASTMRLTALTPAPPTPTTRSTGWPTPRDSPHPRGLVGRGPRRLAHGRGGLGRRLEDVLGDVRAERVAQALLRRRHVDVRLRHGRGVDAERRMRIARVARVRGLALLARRGGGTGRARGLRLAGGGRLDRGALGLRIGLALGRRGRGGLRRRGRRLGGRGGRPLLAGLLLRGLVRAAEQSGQRPLSHARALTACHGREPPSRDRDRTGRPSRPDRTSAPTCP